MFFSGNVQYNKFYWNEGSALNLEKGVIKAPVSGIYTFSFFGQTTPRKNPFVMNRTVATVYLNNVPFQQIIVNDLFLSSGPLTINGQLKMAKGDSLYMRVEEGSLDASVGVYVTGALIQEIYN